METRVSKPCPTAPATSRRELQSHAVTNRESAFGSLRMTQMWSVLPSLELTECRQILLATPPQRGISVALRRNDDHRTHVSPVAHNMYRELWLVRHV